MNTDHGPLGVLETKLREAYDDLWDRFVDPRDALDDCDGTAWLQVGTHLGSSSRAIALSEAELPEIRAQCRELAATNEFAINGHENRISYIVGSGHTYRATIRKGASAPATLAADVQGILDDFLRTSGWNRRQTEIVRRRDRDGEVFLRFFHAPDGTVRMRFVEPAQIATPPDRMADPSAALGIQTDRHDVESVQGYYIDGQFVDAADIQHRKANVDSNVRRGLPLFYPVRKNLRRAEKLLRNMSVVAEIQSAIALIRRHQNATRGAVQQFVASGADATVTGSGRTSSYKRYGPGTILDAPSGIEYDFPAAGLDAGNFVTVLQAELRAIASRLVMPEFMLTSDASNANYASTMVAEGPAIKMFARLQAEQMADDLEVMWRVVHSAIAAGRLPSDVAASVEIQVSPPSLAVRDRLKEAQVFRIEHESGILSRQTWSQRSGLDYDQEQANIALHAAATHENEAEKI